MAHKRLDLWDVEIWQGRLKRYQGAKQIDAKSKSNVAQIFYF